MPQRIKEIELRLDNDGELNILPNHLIEADTTDFVVWRLQNNSRLDSINTETKSGAEIFNIPPHRNSDPRTTEIDQNVLKKARYSYAVAYWKNSDQSAHTNFP